MGRPSNQRDHSRPEALRSFCLGNEVAPDTVPAEGQELVTLRVGTTRVESSANLPAKVQHSCLLPSCQNLGGIRDAN